uniref:Sulfotransferase n=1 Tax=Cajanus cajan TaxID=3821 RepID=A0A151QQ59_CAJCA|nr:Sulfotransferase 17 [Cajanus cajan]
MASTCDDQQANEAGKPLLSLRRERGWADPYLYLFQEFWVPPIYIKEVNKFQNYFQAKDSDVVVASLLKSGTTWLKALTFAIVNRQHFPSPLLTSNPHQLVPYFELIFRGDIHDRILHLSKVTEPRIFGTHISFSSLPKSVTESNCKIIYICRNPFDNFVSAWTFSNNINSESLSALTLEEAFEMYCNGIVPFGPWWSHILGYWHESMAKPNKVLFLKYEDLKENINLHVKRIAEFLGLPFTQEEESNNGLMESIIELCSFEKMKDLKVNKSGTVNFSGLIENKFFFRKGEVGDWVNYFSPSMIEKLSNIIEEKLSGSGLSFKMHW